MFQIDVSRVRSLIFQNGLSVSAFAAKTGLSVTTVKRVLRDGATASLKTISTLAKNLGVDGNSLILKT